MAIKKLITAKELKLKVKDLANEFLMKNYDVKEINLVIVLDGAKRFAEDFIKNLLDIKKFKIKKHFIKLSSYSGTKSSKKVSLVRGIKSDLKNKNIFIIEDIVDTGYTLKFLVNYLKKEKKVKSIKTISLLNKRSDRKVKVNIDYVCFDIPNLFVIGYGLDYNGRFRKLDYIGNLK